MRSSEIQLSADGVALKDLLLYSVVVESSLNRLATAQIFVLDGDNRRQRFNAANDARLLPGKQIALAVGPSDEAVTIFQGIIVRQSLRVNPQVGTLLCLELKHAAVKMSHLRRSASHTAQSDDTVAQALAARSGINLQGSLPARPLHENLLQYNVSDWDFLVMRAEACACCVATLPDGIVVIQPKINPNATTKLDLNADILELEAEVEARTQLYAVSAQAWDYTGQATVVAEQGEYGPVSADGNPSRGGMGASLDESVLAIQHTGAHVIDELQAWADGRILRSELARVRGRVRIWGDAQIRPGDTVAIAGASDAFNGPHFVSAVRHEFTSSGWTTDLEIGMEAAPYAAEFEVNDVPVAGLLTKMPGLQIATVERVEGDPLGQHRVLTKVKALPEDQDGIWARVASVNAGKDHGIFFRPQVGDEVVLGFLNEDPRDAIILGGLFNADAHAPAFSTQKPYAQQGIVTAAGLRLQLDETDEGILLQTPSGDRIQILGKKQGSQGIVIQDQFGNQISLGQKGIVIKSAGNLTLEAATNIDIKANANLTAEAKAKLSLKGNAMGELSTSGILDIKGSLVKIN
jgi:Rhs element Vgr protein